MSVEADEARRQEIVEAAFEVFAEKGYVAAGVADIAQRLQIGNSTFYRYFDSKRDLLDHVVEHAVGRLVEAFRNEVPLDAADSLDELVARARATAAAGLDLLAADPRVAQLILLDITSVDEELTHRLLALADTLGAVAAVYLDHGIRDGIIRAGIDTQVVGQGVLALLGPLAIEKLRGGDPAAFERQLDATADFLLSALRPVHV